MKQLSISRKETLAFLNGLQHQKKHDAINVRRFAILAIIIIGLGIVIPMFPDIKRYLAIRSL
jgi:hypothetical protein